MDYESATKTIGCTPEAAYAALSEAERLRALLVSAGLDGVTATTDGVAVQTPRGPMQLRITGATPHTRVAYEMRAGLPCPIALVADIAHDGDTRRATIKITLHVNLPPMLAPLLGPQFANVAERLAERLATGLADGQV